MTSQLPQSKHLPTELPEMSGYASFADLGGEFGIPPPSPDIGKPVDETNNSEVKLRSDNRRPEPKPKPQKKIHNTKVKSPRRVSSTKPKQTNETSVSQVSSRWSPKTWFPTPWNKSRKDGLAPIYDNHRSSALVVARNTPAVGFRFWMQLKVWFACILWLTSNLRTDDDDDNDGYDDDYEYAQVAELVYSGGRQKIKKKRGWFKKITGIFRESN